MNRRNFLKRCSILPFVGSLAAVVKAEDSVPKLTEDMIAKATNTSDSAIDRVTMAIKDHESRGYKVKEIFCSCDFNDALKANYHEIFPDIILSEMFYFAGRPVYENYYVYGDFMLWCEGNLLLFQDDGEWFEDKLDEPPMRRKTPREIEMEIDRTLLKIFPERVHKMN